MKLKKSLVALVVLAATVSPLANAGLGELAALLRSPLGRFFLMETEEGLLLNRLIMGSEEASQDLNAVIGRLGRQEVAPLASQLEGRLGLVQERFRMRAAMQPVEAEQLLRGLSRETLSLRQIEGQGINFLPVNEYTVSLERAAFAAGEHPGRLAGRDFAGELISGGKLTHADLRFADMRGMEAIGADLEGAQMLRADLSGSRFTNANLNRAKLEHAVLERTNLGNARMRGAQLSNANLRGANLRGADLRGADLRGADLTDAVVNRTLLRGGLDVQVESALFDATTKLPFSREEAVRLGMVFVE